MESIFGTIDWVIFIGCLVAVMALGLAAGWRDRTAEDFYLAGRKVKWWGVAGSIFGSNISANHLVGMMGIGFSVGFAQAHFELGAIAGLMLLCYGFLPVYRNLRLYTLSEYLENRFDHRSRLAFALISLIFMGLIQMAPALYIGSRSMCVMIGGDALQQAEHVDANVIEQVNGQEQLPAAEKPSIIAVNKTYYTWLVIVLAAVSATYTIVGGLRAVVITDVVQSVLMLVAGVLVAYFVFDKIGGWDQFRAIDASQETGSKMGLYLPANHPDLPWLGVFTGLMAMHFFYWGTNQFIVQRALGAESDEQARVGIIFAGFTKLLIPFFSIATGIAVYYLFKSGGREIAADAAFPEAVRLVVPLGIGLVGLIAAGLIGAILSSVDSMLNSAATIFTIDIYQRYFRPDAEDAEKVLVGRIVILLIVIAASLVALLALDANSTDNFFLNIANYQNYLTPGVLVVFLVGMFWKRATARAAFVTIILGVVLSVVLQWTYDNAIGDKVLASNSKLFYAAIDELEVSKLTASDWPDGEVEGVNLREMTTAAQENWLDERGDKLSEVARLFGPKLNFFYRVTLVVFICVILFGLLSFLEPPDMKKAANSWTDVGGQSPRGLALVLLAMFISVVLFSVLGWMTYHQNLHPQLAASIGGIWTFSMFLIGAIITTLKQGQTGTKGKPPRSLFVRFLQNDRLYAGVLCGLAIYMLFYFS